MAIIEVKRHYGKSVFIWRIYRVIGPEYRRIRTQLGKYRTEAEAQKAAGWFRERERVTHPGGADAIRAS
jgi:hypothetical protein